MTRRLRLPSLPLWSLGALAWGLTMASCFLLSIHVFGHASGSHDMALAAIYAGGGMLGWLVALPLVQISADGREAPKIFTAWFLLLGLATMAATAGLFALQYRFFYAHWHAPFPSRIWVYQFVFTSASALYQFAVLGLRHFLPTAFLILLLLAVLMARRSR